MHTGSDDSGNADRVFGFAATYWRPLLVLTLSLPVVAYALLRSWIWFAAPFPGFFLMENNVVPTVSGIPWPAQEKDVFHKQLIAVDGQAVRSSAEAYRYVAQHPPGTLVEYTFRDGDSTTKVTLASQQFGMLDYVQTCGVLMLFGGAWLSFGLIVGFLQPRTVQSHVYLWQALVAGLYPILGIFLHQPGFSGLTKLYFVLECLFPATWIHLAMVFPIERRFGSLRRAWAVAVLYSLSAMLAAAVLHGFYADPPDLGAIHVTYLLSGLSFLFFMVASASAYRATADDEVKARIKVVLIGTMLAGTVALFALTNSAVADRSFPVQFGLILSPAFSACVAYGIAKHDLFDIDRVVRQSFVYALLTSIIILAYSLTLLGSTRLLPSAAPMPDEFVGLAFILLVAFALNPLRRLLQHLVDRAFFRTRLDYQATITQLSAAMTTLLDPSEVLEQVTSVVSSAMHLERVEVVLIDGDEVEHWMRTAGGELERRATSHAALQLRRVWDDSPDAFQPNAILDNIADRHARRELADWVGADGVKIILPLMFRSRITGIFALGAKRSGQAFGGDDVDLLRTLANQTAIAIQNARSYAALQDLTRDLDAKVRARTDALSASNQQLTRAYDELKTTQAQLVQSEKMASLGQLVAGVAHELNNPTSFVAGSLANLSDYFTALREVLEAYAQAPIADAAAAERISEAQQRNDFDYVLGATPELLRICAEGTERIRKIVADLRIFARADGGERLPTDLQADIESTLRLLAQRIHGEGVEVECDYQPIPHIEAYSAQLNQVWMNLLTNALDAVQGRPHPHISIKLAECRGNGSQPAGTWVEVTIADNGAGISAADRERIFEPFFTTKPIGRGTGLGLSIAFGAVKSHGGRVYVDSEVGVGTVIKVQLPVHSIAGAADAA